MLCRVRSAWRPRAECPRRLLRRSPWSLHLCDTQSPLHGLRCLSSSNAKPAKDSVLQPSPPNARLFSAVLTTNSPSSVTVDQLFAAIQDPIEDSDVSAFAGAPLLAILLTPSFARHALDPDFPLKAWKIVTGATTAANPVNIITAVVDKLPCVEQEDGMEGLAYSLTFDKHFTLDRGTDAARVLGRQAQYQDKTGTLTFETPAIERSTRKYSFHLPLAQTVFSTGRPSTLVHTQYQPDSKGRLRMVEHNACQSATLRVEDAVSGPVLTHIPLIPLTPARRVERSMGNVLRKVSSGPLSILAMEDGDAASQPSSQELEDAISKYFQMKDMRPEPVAVWALIVPPASYSNVGQLLGPDHVVLWDPEAVRRTWMLSDSGSVAEFQSALDDDIRQLITGGARLCKVLSGGGGWGKKAGLLSLDPDTSYNSSEDRGLNFDDSADVDSTTPAFETEKAKALGDIVKEGDAIMFFLAPSSLSSYDSALNHGLIRDEELRHDMEIDHPEILVMGAIPSSVDSNPLAKTAETPPKVRSMRNIFGMLSEGGMALGIIPTSTEEKSQADRDVLRTKLDVPYCTASFHVFRGPGPVSAANKWGGANRPATARENAQGKHSRAYSTTTMAQETTNQSAQLHDPTRPLIRYHDTESTTGQLRLRKVPIGLLMQPSQAEAMSLAKAERNRAVELRKGAIRTDTPPFRKHITPKGRPPPPLHVLAELAFEKHGNETIDKSNSRSIRKQRVQRLRQRVMAAHEAKRSRPSRNGTIISSPGVRPRIQRIRRRFGRRIRNVQLPLTSATQLNMDIRRHVKAEKQRIRLQYFIWAAKRPRKTARYLYRERKEMWDDLVAPSPSIPDMETAPPKAASVKASPPQLDEWVKQRLIADVAAFLQKR